MRTDSIVRHRYGRDTTRSPDDYPATRSTRFLQRSMTPLDWTGIDRLHTDQFEAQTHLRLCVGTMVQIENFVRAQFVARFVPSVRVGVLGTADRPARAL